MSDPKEDVKEKTQKTAELYFKGVAGERPFEVWRSFDKELARDISLFYTGKLYAREKIPHRTRQLAAVAALTVLERTEELKMHLHAAMNVGCPPPGSGGGHLPDGHLRRRSGGQHRPKGFSGSPSGERALAFGRKKSPTVKEHRKTEIKRQRAKSKDQK